MPTPGEKIDRFVVEEQLGRGGMASVYRVRHTGLGSLHALKVLDLRFEAVRERLRLEGQVQAQLAHPNIVAVTDLVQVEGAPGLILEYVPGPPLDVWLSEHRPDPATIDALFRSILDGVVHAHAFGLVHRDLKPGNILLHEIEGRLVPKIADFGLAKLLDDDQPAMTRTGVAMGTPGYMAPEQIRSAKDVDQRADVFALGCILYALWVGGRPFQTDSLIDSLTEIESKRYLPPKQARPDLPDRVARAIDGCLEPDRTRRIASAAALRSLLFPPPVAEPPSTQPAPAPPPPPPALASPPVSPAVATAPSSDPLAPPSAFQPLDRRAGSDPARVPQRPARRPPGPSTATVVVVIVILCAIAAVLVTLSTFGLFVLGLIGAAVGPHDDYDYDY